VYNWIYNCKNRRSYLPPIFTKRTNGEPRLVLITPNFTQMKIKWKINVKSGDAIYVTEWSTTLPIFTTRYWIDTFCKELPRRFSWNSITVQSLIPDHTQENGRTDGRGVVWCARKAAFFTYEKPLKDAKDNRQFLRHCCEASSVTTRRACSNHSCALWRLLQLPSSYVQSRIVAGLPACLSVCLSVCVEN
jgi:hypothetical protein